MSINRVVLIGRPTRDPEFRSTQSGTSLLSFRLAFNTRRKNASTGQWEDSPNFIDVTLFGNRAESLKDVLRKGSLIGVDGKLRWREWESPSGEKRSAIEVVADDISFVGPKDSGAGASAPEKASGGGGEPAIDDLGGEEIPF